MAMFAAIRMRLIAREQLGCRFAGPAHPRNRTGEFLPAASLTNVFRDK
jgi:hypothetical protein